jgi:hypothetical protein
MDGDDKLPEESSLVTKPWGSILVVMLSVVPLRRAMALPMSKAGESLALSISLWRRTCTRCTKLSEPTCPDVIEGRVIVVNVSIKAHRCTIELQAIRWKTAIHTPAEMIALARQCEET